MDNSSNNIDNSSSKYFDACSNSNELKEIMGEKDIEKEIITKNKEINNDNKINNIYESPQRISNNNFNAITNNSTSNNNSSNKYINMDKNIIISTKEQTQSDTEKAQLKNKIRKKVNIYTMNSVKKNLMSPIEENKQFEFSNINSNEKIKSNIKNLNEVTNNNNNNININIIINKKKRLPKDSKYNNTSENNLNNSKKAKSRNQKEEIINTNINKDSISLYSSMDKYSNSTMSKKFEKPELSKRNNINFINNKNSEFSLIEMNTKIFGNSVSESLIHNKARLNYPSLMINSITFQNIARDILTTDDLRMKYNLRDIPVKRKEGFALKSKYINTLIELQIFNFGDSPIWVLKISHNGKYLAAGNKAGKIRLYELMGYDYDKYEKVYNNKNIINYLYFVNEKPIIELSEHKKDITDLSWSSFKYSYLLSSSLDNYVFLWDISKNNNCLIEKFRHDDYITCIQFSPANENIFITGCFDKFFRIYSIKDENYNVRESLKKSSTFNFSIIHITEKITALSFFPDGRKIAIGTINGKIYIYDYLSNSVRYNIKFNCRNRVGKNSLGKKVTSIKFINKKNAIISTCDSCVRLISMKEGKNLSKYKGYLNENSMIRSDVDLSNDVILTGSENGFCYTWKILPEDEKYLKNYNYESFKPFERDVVECSIVVDEKCFVNYVQKVLKFTNKINIISILINSTDNGKIEVLLNINEEIN